MDETHNQITDLPAKISFADLCIHLEIDGGVWDVIDRMADVPDGTFWKLFLGRPVRQVLAEKALRALSEHDGETTWTLNNVEVCVLPSTKPPFVDALRRCLMPYQNLIALAARVGIDERVIDRMRMGKPVDRADAEKVLLILSLHTDHDWSYDTVDIPLLPPPSARQLRLKYERQFRNLQKSHKFFSKKRG